MPQNNGQVPTKPYNRANATDSKRLESFPQKPAVEERVPDLLVNSGDCSICFSSRLNDKLPEVICKNKVCENCYHVECLYEWLMSVNARRFFSDVVGLCPNCEKNITCPIPK
ncbi:E3 ubiquitin-protein ligase FANCL-like [Anoplophora glabripennis]|uniref:E3 ubiquitin-protein ligase FANCL-like n=1 Tax=Anoplophora glabripennis TaxID=217634 RepID=UPI000874CF7A|nr:E3 ubiquitin-protein ligase FANCL-like [Anoplophora glabripennis]